MTETKQFIPKSGPSLGKNGQPIVNEAKVEALRKMKEVTPTMLCRGIRPSSQRPGQFDPFGMYTADINEVYHAINNAVAFEVFTVGSQIMSGDGVKTEEQWREESKAWAENETRQADLKRLAELKAKYPEA